MSNDPINNSKQQSTTRKRRRNNTFFNFRPDPEVENPAWVNPLPDHTWSLPIGKYHPGGFGYMRNHSIHTGVDLYASVGSRVCAVEDGKVVQIENFTGLSAGSSWYNETQAVLIEGTSGVVLYGEIKPSGSLQIGNAVKAGEHIGNVLAVLKEDKGNGVSMLHFEVYTKGTRSSVWWHHGKHMPKNLLDPTQYLLSLKVSKKKKYVDTSQL
jgi:murein DD-endopeptidase MepM/ murein hydrolase activator NlpD